MKRAKILLFFFLNIFFAIRICFAISIKEEARDYRQKGYEAQSKGDLDSALSYYQKAIQTDPYFVSAYNDLGIVCEMKGYLDKAEEAYKRAIQIDPEYLASYSNLALLYERKSDILKAAEFWRKRIQLGDLSELWTQKAKERLKALGIISPEIRRIILEEEATDLSRHILEEKRRAEEERKVKIKTHFDLGMSYYLKGDYQEAQKEFKEALTLDPQNSEIKELLDKLTHKVTESKIRESSEKGIKAYKDEAYSQALKEFEGILSLIQSRVSEKFSK